MRAFHSRHYEKKAKPEQSGPLSFALLGNHFHRRQEATRLQARVFAGKAFLAASEIRYNTTNSETLDVRLPANAAALPSEYETQTRAIAARYPGPLADLQETGERQDITYLIANLYSNIRVNLLRTHGFLFAKPEISASQPLVERSRSSIVSA